MRTLSRVLIWSSLIGVLAGACGSGSTPPPPPPPPPGPPATLAKQAGDGQNGTVGAAVATVPSVKVTDASSVALSGVAVTFAVATGGGSVTGGSATTGANGIATLGSWILGPVPGANTLTATIAGSGVSGNPATFTATAAAGPAQTMTKQAGDNQVVAASTAVAVAPSVKVVDQFGNPLAGLTVTFAVASGGGAVTGATPVTDATGVATVGSWTSGAAPGPNTLTATIAPTGVTGNPATFTATVPAPAFNPLANTNLGGTQAFTSVNIPAGVTVTMTADLVLNVTGNVTVAGNIVGDCKNLTINADGALTVSGNLNNGCAGAIPAGGLPVMTLVGKGGWTLNGPGAWTAGGDVTVTNDPTLTDANFAPGAPAPPARLRTNGPLAAVGEPCINNGYSGTAVPARAPDGANGTPNGGDGQDGKTWTLRCKGGSNIIISGALTLTGQNGGNGGDGTHSSSTAAVSKGGKAGKGGTVSIQALDNISIGAGSVIFTGDGGRGGTATADGSAGHGGTVGASADATGGAGASPGLFSAVAKSGSISINGSLNLQIGTGGRGGNAFAIGGDGHDAPACLPAAGGPATATAGDGGSTPDKKLQASGAVNGLGNVTVGGGAAGDGGDAHATGGKGGKGDQPCKDGALGGDPTAKGGKGGDANLKDQNGVKIANGGDGGSMEHKNARGGAGWSDCVAPFEAGGNGGKGGTTHGFNGSGGTGFAAGTFGAAIFNVVSDGGNGGNGQGPGAGGLPGDNSALLINVAATIINPSFQPGVPGNPCTPPQPAQVSLNLTQTTPPLTPGVVQPGTYVVQLLDAATQAVVGTINLIAQGPSGNTFYGNDAGGGGSRIGWSGALGSWIIDLTSAIVNGQPYTFTSWQECVLNTSVDASNPVLIEEIDQSNAVVATTKVTTSPSCVDVPVGKGHRVRNSKSGKGSFADKKDMKGKGS